MYNIYDLNQLINTDLVQAEKHKFPLLSFKIHTHLKK